MNKYKLDASETELTKVSQKQQSRLKANGCRTLPYGNTEQSDPRCRKFIIQISDELINADRRRSTQQVGDGRISSEGNML